MNVKSDYSEKTQKRCAKLISQLQLPTSYYKTIYNIIFPLTTIILSKQTSKPLLVSINGAQGTGKTTLTRFIRHTIESEFSCRVAELSLDDFYKTRAERKEMAKQVHPLFITRGVPGTHNLELLSDTIHCLLDGKPCIVPRFNKAADDRYDKSQSTHYNKPVDIILFEGWCNNSPVQTEDELLKPVNQLEKLEDSEGVWRRYSNDKLKAYHDLVFKYVGLNIMLQAPDFQSIFEWRKLQESKLGNSIIDSKIRIMNNMELHRFIQHFERITRHTLKVLPEKADIILPVKKDQMINEIINRL